MPEELAKTVENRWGLGAVENSESKKKTFCYETFR